MSDYPKTLKLTPIELIFHQLYEINKEAKMRCEEKEIDYATKKLAEVRDDALLSRAPIQYIASELLMHDWRKVK